MVAYATRGDRAVAMREIALMRRIHIFRLAQSGWSYVKIASYIDRSPSRVSQVIHQEQRRRMNRWRKGLCGPAFVRGLSPVDEES